MTSAPAPVTSRYATSRQRRRKARKAAETPMIAHSTPSLPSQVTALTTETRAPCPAMSPLIRAAAP